MDLTLLGDSLSLLSFSAIVISTVMVILNAIFATKLGSTVEYTGEKPLVSLLIPVRNEAENIPHLLTALLSSTYRPMEVIILDDESDDDSSAIVNSFISNATIPLKIVRGAPWNESKKISGKAHACAQLADLANGDILIFCDADVRPSTSAVRCTVDLLMQPQARKLMSGLSALPAQSCQGLLERLLIPWIMNLPLMISLPLFCCWRLPTKSMQMANGQWVALFKSDYFKSGGHRKLGLTPLEDVALARQIHGITGRGVQPVLAANHIRVSMYPNWRATLAGFSKNLVAIGGGTPLIFGCIIASVNFVFLFPFWGYFYRPDLAVISLCLLALSRILTARSFKMPLRDLLLHPLSLLLLNIAAYKAISSSLRGRYEWKGRVVKWSPT
jgi:chlorobactene glucosyltransferase